MNNQRMFHRLLLAGAALAVITAGCGVKDKPASQQQSQQAPAATSQTSPAPAPSATPAQAAEPQMKSADIQAYFGDEDGNAIVAKTTKITYATDADKYTAALKSLQQSSDPKATALFEGIAYNKVTFEQGKLKLDLKIDDSGRLGSGGEALMLQALRKTLFQFAEVQEIYVTVDGKQVESLMGHMDLPYPMKRNSE
ncbi:GerMN domain-containing protein [Paenibacillus chartarius]|uniref:GerMN domain-containing protein n=1 Tax=Paenibacillus chartarius TaxID=747481 RepID=A0ABV6DQB0_9BACL